MIFFNALKTIFLTVALIISFLQNSCLSLSQTRQNSQNNNEAHHLTLDNDFSNEIFSPRSLPNPIMSRTSFFAVSAGAMMIVPSVAHATTDISETANPSLSNTPDTSLSAVSKSSKSISASTSLQESISGFVAGASLGAVKTVVKFPLDTATVRLQMPNSDYSIRDLTSLFNGSYNGITLSLLSNIPAGAVFFAFKDATKASLKASPSFFDAPKWLTTSIAVAVAQVPYWIVRNPGEVIKVRQQAGIDGYGNGVSAFKAVQKTFTESSSNGTTTLDGIEEFYTGYWENIAYAYPADVIKFVAYEALTKGRKDLSPIEGAEAGALATACAQLITTPLDVIRNRLMTRKDRNGVSLSKDENDLNESYLEALIRLSSEEGVKGLFAGASPRVGKAILSGAIQFAAYEETKQSIAKMIQR